MITSVGTVGRKSLFIQIELKTIKCLMTDFDLVFVMSNIVDSIIVTIWLSVDDDTFDCSEQVSNILTILSRAHKKKTFSDAIYGIVTGFKCKIDIKKSITAFFEDWETLVTPNSVRKFRTS